MISECPVCSSNNLREIVILKHIPVHIGTFYATLEEAQAAQKGSLRLMGCLACGHAFNQCFSPDLIAYDTDYDNSLFFSEYFRGFAQQVCKRLSLNYDFAGKRILEIGCGFGDFLHLLCDLNGAAGVGYDPSLPVSTRNTERIRFIKDALNPKKDQDSYDGIVCRHVLEHLVDPAALAADIAVAASRKPQTVVYLEVPNFDYTLRETAVWDLIYEHCQYFTASSFTYLMKQAGFETLDLYETFGGQYLAGEFHWIGNSKVDIGNEIPWEAIWNRFSTAATEKINTWRKGVKEMGPSAAWGAGAKGVSFLFHVDDIQSIPWIVDINPRKEGLFVPCSGQQVISSNGLISRPVENIFLMNRIYYSEVENLVRKIGLDLPITSV